jgi:hypothetical protein
MEMPKSFKLTQAAVFLLKEMFGSFKIRLDRTWVLFDRYVDIHLCFDDGSVLCALVDTQTGTVKFRK